MTFQKYGGSAYEPLVFDEAGSFGTMNTATIGPAIDFSVIDMLKAIHEMKGLPAFLEEKKTTLNKLLLLVK